MKDLLEKVQNGLIEKSKDKGFIVFDDIFDVSQQFGLSVSDINILTNSLLEKNIIIQEEGANKKIDDTESPDDDFESDFRDFAQIDYNQIFEDVIRISPAQKFFVEYVRKILPPQKNEIQTLLFQAKDGNCYARNRIIEMHLRLALKTALYYSKAFKQSVDEMISLSCEGLIKVLNNYKTDVNGAFSSYASMWMMQVMRRNILTNTTSIYYPAHFMDFYIKFFPNRKTLFLGRKDLLSASNIKKLMNFLGCNDLYSKQILIAYSGFVSIDVLSNNNSKIKNTLDFFDFENAVLDSILRENTNKILDELINIKNVPNRFKLTNKELRILKERSGYFSEKCETLESLGEKYNVTRERIRQIEKKGILKIRESSYGDRLLDIYQFLDR